MLIEHWEKLTIKIQDLDNQNYGYLWISCHFNGDLQPTQVVVFEPGDNKRLGFPKRGLEVSSKLWGYNYNRTLICNHMWSDGW